MLVYDSSGGGGTTHFPDSPVELAALLDLDAYIDAMHALGLRSVIAIGLPAGMDS